MLRALQAGLSLADLERIDYVLMQDILTEAGNDGAHYETLATQADFDRF